MSATLQAAYRAARYRIDCGTRVVERRIGVIDRAADAALARAGCRLRWAVVTPCNPGSRALGVSENARRLRRLHAELERRGWRHLPALNCAADGSWPEPGACLLDIDGSAVAALARRYGQLAFVAGRLGAAPALRWLAPRLRANRGP